MNKIFIYFIFIYAAKKIITWLNNFVKGVPKLLYAL